MKEIQEFKLKEGKHFLLKKLHSIINHNRVGELFIFMML
jgi:hypothetical protein